MRLDDDSVTQFETASVAAVRRALRRYLSVFAHVVGVLPNDWKDRIPKRVFQDAGLKTKFWPVPKTEHNSDGFLRVRYGHGLHRDGFRIQICAASGGGPEKAKAEY